MRLGFLAPAALTFVFPAFFAAQQPSPLPPPVSSGDSTSPAPALKTVRVEGRKLRARSYLTGSTPSATKIPLPPRDIPQAMTLITGRQIADQGMQSMADVVRYVPGVTMGQGEGNRDQPTIRGNATTADFFVNGVRDDSQYFRDLYDVERVEALKGPNAMVFGRGGGGGVINRVTKEPDEAAQREITLQAGSFGNRRITADFGGAVSEMLAGRTNMMHERSHLFRDAVALGRTGVHPVVSIRSRSGRTRATTGFEYFRDHRTADRGIPSFGTAPISTDASTFFGSPTDSYSDARVRAAEATVSHQSAAGLSLRSHTRLAAHDKVYQNIYPGSVTADGAQVSILAYNDAAARRNVFSQLDMTFRAARGIFSHALLVGGEAGRQASDNFRKTGFFNNVATSVLAPVSRPTISTPVTFRQSATDAANHVAAAVGSVYAQDVIGIGDRVQVIAGVRSEFFDLRLDNHRSGTTLRRRDRMVSPRVGLVAKPAPLASLYASFSVSHLPASGDQFSSLTDLTKTLEPERFTNHEIGAKWDVADRVALSAAAYRLDRTNTRAPAPDDPTRIVQTGRQRSTGYELGVSGTVSGNWEIAGGYASQRAIITSTTANAPAGARVPLVPRATLSLWNKFLVSPAVSIGGGLVRQSEMFAAINNTVRLPAFTRLDGALYLRLSGGLRAQVNIENLFDARYFATAHSNNNISPGSPRAVRASLTTSF
ncbi:MAG: TonB-dependent siderophore receptor [Gemmatimonadaceae bacterium]|nr:TonB-dependent siderophore receptor [Gemmatimonadaceae bacterium]